MDTDRAGKLRETCNSRLNLVLRHKHQVRKFVNNDHNVRDRGRDHIVGIPCRLNLIPYNPPGGPGGASPRIKEFQLELIAAGVRAYLRAEKGADIAAACGQLAATVFK